jgi:hypothetical protein
VVSVEAVKWVDKDGKVATDRILGSVKALSSDAITAERPA